MIVQGKQTDMSNIHASIKQTIFNTLSIIKPSKLFNVLDTLNDFILE